MKVNEAMSTKAQYVAPDTSLREKGIYRLIVLDDREHKKLAGILSLGDILRHDQEKLAASTAKDISSQAA